MRAAKWRMEVQRVDWEHATRSFSTIEYGSQQQQRQRRTMARSDKLARLRAARGGARVNEVVSDDETNHQIYDEVDENQYRKHKRDRVLNDDFIVDDNGEGYAETGADEWEAQVQSRYADDDDDGINDGEEEDGEHKIPKKITKIKSIKTNEDSSNINTKKIDSFFKAQPISIEEKMKLKQKKKTESDSSILNDILSDFTSMATKSIKKKPVENKRKNPFSSLKPEKFNTSTPASKKTFSMPMSGINTSSGTNRSFEFTSPSAKKQKTLNMSTTNDETSFYTAHQFDDSAMDFEPPSSPIKDLDSASKSTNILDDLNNVSMDMNDSVGSKVKEEKTKGDNDGDDVDDDDDDDDDDDIIISTKRKTKVANIDRSFKLNAVKSKKKPIDSSPLKNVKAMDFNSSPSKHSNTSNISISNMSNITFEKLEGHDVLMKDEDGDDSVQMYWLDYIELETSLLLFGKIKSTDGRFVSGVVQVTGICKELYFLPRKQRLLPDDEDEEDVTSAGDSETPCSPMDVYDEIVPLLMDKFGIDTIRAKPQKMKYAFEHYEIPAEAEYLKVLLPYDTPKSKGVQIPPTLSGETFSTFFGYNTSIFESFVMQRQIMGPCWLTITGCNFNVLQNVSHCNIELNVSSPDDISPNLYNRDEPPPLNVLSINVQSYLNPKNQRQEVGSVSLALYKDLPQDVPISSNIEPTEQITLVRPVGGTTTLPIGLNGLAEKKGMNLRTLNSEKILLNCVTGMVKKYDPDVFIGHRLEGVTLDILLHRMKDLGVTQWSNFGRRQRKAFPEKFNRSNGRYNLFLIRDMLAGRLLCDISNDMGQSLTMKCQNWDLEEMYSVVCREKYSPMEVNLANPLIAEDANKLLAAVNENLQAVKIIAKTAFGMQILSISKQLTNLAGNAWSHTLGGTRAGRNEYILLHEFEREGYIVPDRETQAQRKKEQQKRDENDEEDHEESNTVSNNKKAKFQGGLVFEPEKGLHKNYVLVMDFNSLYPSIIQEFNICFTTVDRSSLVDDELPKVPTKKEIGVLPKLLQQLVSRRREVKNLMKDPKLTPIERAQLDIKQLALKVTANSMYGCLGYVNSRFYAKPLAMLVTNKGREILMDTRQLAESLGLTVVYGDTDSVMIDTRCDNLPDAIKVGEGFKEKVNERYRLLEIDIDNVFKRLLLHSKKKYAALNAFFNEKGEEMTALEVKGLDMRRREYCPLSKELSIFVLNQILNNSDPQEALNAVYNRLEEVREKFKENKIPMVNLRINTKLSKDPNKYPGGKSMPAVQVALRLQHQGKVIKAGSVITFVITTGENSGEPLESSNEKELSSNASSIAERARAFVEVIGKDYKPDIKYYTEKQLFNPIDRLLTRVDGYDVVRLASSLGLESQRYESKARDIIQQNELQPLESTIPDSERFRDMKDFPLKCLHCSCEFPFGGIQSSSQYLITFQGVKCGKCSSLFHPLMISSQLELFIRDEIARYYQCWLLCDDCGIETRQVSVYGKRCIGSDGTAHSCKGVMKIKYTDKMMYNQLLYLNSIFDADKAKAQKLKELKRDGEDKDEDTVVKASGYNQGEIDALAEQNRRQFKIYQDVVHKYLNLSGRRYVDLGKIFRFS